jgi:acyl-CoA thioesterase-1
MWFRRSSSRSYGTKAVRVQRLAALALVTMICATAPGAAVAADAPLKIVVLGDSLSAGFGLPADAAFPAKLAVALKAKSIAADVINAGVSGDTASGGLARVDWSIPDGTDAVILEIGANDALRGLDPALTKKALDAILGKLQERHIAVLFAGMRAPRNMGEAYARDFDAIFPALAASHVVVFYPFFLEGVATDAKLNQADGMHPTPPASTSSWRVSCPRSKN